MDFTSVYTPGPRFGRSVVLIPPPFPALDPSLVLRRESSTGDVTSAIV